MLSREAIKGKKGVSLVLVALMIFTLVGIIALAIDVGHLMATRNELQNVADAAALAGAGELALVYLGDEFKDLSSYAAKEAYISSDGSEEVVNAVQEVAGKNKASRKTISILSDDIIIGKWDSTSKEVDLDFENPDLPDAVYVKARRDESANSPISTFFARIFGMNTMNVTAEAVAALSGPESVPEGELKMPIGLSQNMFPHDCTDEIILSPTTESCAGWHFFLDKDTNIDSKILGFIKLDTECENCGTYINGPSWMEQNKFEIKKEDEISEIPKVKVGDKFYFQGGDIASLFTGSYLDVNTYYGNTGVVLGNPKKDPAPIVALFDYFRYRDGDNDNTKWTTTIPVYKESEGCGNPHGLIEIVGFAEIEVFEVKTQPNKSLRVNIDCELAIIEGRGSGVTYGNLVGSIPGLVK